MPRSRATLLLNGDTEGHRERLLELLAVSTRFECVVAFAKMSGWVGLAVPLTTALKRGLKARLTVGLSFYQTEPALLDTLLKLSRNNSSVEVFVGDPPAAFHSKIYTFGGRGGGSAIVGSANLTSGGFNMNYEASMEVDDADGALMAEVAAHVDMLIEQKVLVRLTQRLIDDYARKFEINRIYQAVARRRTARAIDRTGFDIDTLRAALDILREDKTETGFEAMVALRRDRRRQAVMAMQRLVATPPATKEDFIDAYDTLIRQFSSGGLYRGRTRIANHYGHFLDALAEAQQLADASPADACKALSAYFKDIGGAGVNMLTEVLLAINSKRFANMNQNAVAGMARANITEFPERPLKTNVDAQVYADYCARAERLREQLGLADFIELDTLFNHLYWA